MAFQMNCPHCRKMLNITEKAFGQTLPCPGCGKPLTVPQPPVTRPAQHPVGVQAAPQHAPPGTGRWGEVPQQPVKTPGEPMAVKALRRQRPHRCIGPPECRRCLA